MQSRRKTPLYDRSTPAITPTPTTLTPQTLKLIAATNDAVDRAEHAEGEARGLRILLAAERKRSAKLAGALSRYVEILENVCADQRQAFIELNQPLVPNVLLRKDGKR